MHFTEIKTSSAARHVLGLSGGKDSAALAIYIKDKYPQSIILNDMPFDQALKTFRKEIV